MLELNKIYCINCLDGMKLLDENSIDFMFTSPPYNVGVDYDIHKDTMPMDEYYKFIGDWFKGLYNVMKDDGRIAINVPYEVNMRGRGGRTFIIGDYYKLMLDSGFKFQCLVHLSETAPHRVKYTAFGSWLSASAPYVYNPLEAVLIGYKNSWKKQEKGESYFTKDNYHKREFLKLISGIWDYRAETRGLTKANFNIDLPKNAIKLLTYNSDIVLDPFAGSGTTLCAAKLLNRNYIGFEISEKYCEIIKSRLSQTKLLPGEVI
jgi:site-specific DNA-methyltransferase (adenine-specific)